MTTPSTSSSWSNFQVKDVSTYFSKNSCLDSCVGSLLLVFGPRVVMQHELIAWYLSTSKRPFIQDFNFHQVQRFISSKRLPICLAKKQFFPRSFFRQESGVYICRLRRLDNITSVYLIVDCENSVIFANSLDRPYMFRRNMSCRKVLQMIGCRRIDEVRLCMLKKKTN